MAKFNFTESVKYEIWDETPITIEADTEEEAIEILKLWYKNNPNQLIRENTDNSKIIVGDSEFNLNYCDRLYPSDNDNQPTLIVERENKFKQIIYKNINE
jgi:hypothetical protein